MIAVLAQFLFSLSFAGSCFNLEQGVRTLTFDSPGMKIWVDSTDSEEVWQYDIPPNPLTRKTYVSPVTLNFSRGFHEVTAAKMGEDGFYSTSETHYIGITPKRDKDERMLKKFHEHSKEKQQFRKEINIPNLHKLYEPLYPDLWIFKDSYLTETFREAVRSKSISNLVTRASPFTELFTLEIFSLHFLEMLFEELKYAENHDIPWTRPNSMNNQGFLLSQLGFDQFIHDFLHSWFIPFAEMIYPEWDSRHLDSAHAFTVKYETDGDLVLDPHMDQSQLTLNTHIGGIHKGSKVKFKGVLHNDASLESERIEVEQSPRMSLLHIGQHWHESTPLESGERYNLIFWFRSSMSLKSPYEKFRSQCIDRVSTLKQEL